MAKKKSIDLDQFFKPAAAADDLDFLLGATPEETAERAAERGLPLAYLPTVAVAPDPHQLRHLPHPDELVRLADAGDRAAGELVAGLRELGQSMVEHGQIQPVIVYPDTDPADPAITHRLLNGQRRWSAALLVGLPTIWAVEMPRPTDVSRLLHQFEENERREGFSDMERAWALVSLKDALQAEAGGEVPWTLIEEQLQLSDARRRDLLRLLRFSSEGQALILRYRWPEWTLRPLHMAISAGKIDQDAATDILRGLTHAAEVSAPIVSAAVEDYRRHAGQATEATGQTDGTTASPAPAANRDESLDIARQIGQMRRRVERVGRQASLLGDSAARQAVRAAAEELRRSLDTLLESL